MGWFRKLLSDMALADSVMIGHPYYWQPSIRRRLTRVMRYLKRLYGKLALKERRRKRSLAASGTEKEIEMICPRQISKIVINQHPSKYLMSSGTTHETLNVMLEHLVTKWFGYQHHHNSHTGESVEEIANAYAAHHPPPHDQDLTGKGNEFLESVTFLDFHPNERDFLPSAIPSQELSSISLSSVISPPSSYEDVRAKNYKDNNSNDLRLDENGNLLRASSARDYQSSYDDLSDKYSRHEELLDPYGSSTENLQSSSDSELNHRHCNNPT